MADSVDFLEFAISQISLDTTMSRPQANWDEFVTITNPVTQKQAFQLSLLAALGHRRLVNKYSILKEEIRINKELNGFRIEDGSYNMTKLTCIGNLLLEYSKLPETTKMATLFNEVYGGKSILSMTGHYSKKTEIMMAKGRRLRRQLHKKLVKAIKQFRLLDDSDFSCLATVIHEFKLVDEIIDEDIYELP